MEKYVRHARHNLKPQTKTAKIRQDGQTNEKAEIMSICTRQNYINDPMQCPSNAVNNKMLV